MLRFFVCNTYSHGAIFIPIPILGLILDGTCNMIHEIELATSCHLTFKDTIRR